MKILLTGATGFLGRNLRPRLRQAGHSLVVLARDPSRTAARAQGAQDSDRIFAWDGVIGLPPAEAFEGVDAVINLIGESVATRWTTERKRRFRDSRILPTRSLVERMASLPAPARPRVLLSMAGVGYYGDRKEEVLTESSGPGTGFLATLGQDWESAALGARDLGVRVVVFRSGVVLGKGGGILDKLLPVFRLGLGGRLGSGRQYFPWIHLDDALGLLEFALTCEALGTPVGADVDVGQAGDGAGDAPSPVPSVKAVKDKDKDKNKNKGNQVNGGPVNAVAPEPATNAEFTAALGQALHRPAVLTLPGMALRLAMGEMAEEMLLVSQRVSPIAALRAGYEFRQPLLTGALRACLGD